MPAAAQRGLHRFFTVGCEKSFNNDGDAHRAKGYVEFAINSVELAAKALNYLRAVASHGLEPAWTSIRGAG